MKYLEQQRIEQARWRPLPGNSRSSLFNRLLENEFIDSAQRQRNLDHRVSELIRYSIENVPYYGQLAAQRELDKSEFSGITDLYKFPLLDRTVVQDQSEELITTTLPTGQQNAGRLRTSGSTGQPVEILHTVSSLQHIDFLKQREYRSWGFDPNSVLASIRPASDLLRPHNQLLKPCETLRLNDWEYVGRHFQTGQMLMLPDTSGTEFMVEWLEQNQPDYLLSMSATLEQLAIGYSGKNLKPEIAGALAISQQLTDGMRRLVESKLSPHIEQNYGLNEVGLVAMRCPLSGQYHVHNEACVIEIVDREGNSCEPGQPGKLLVTALHNLAMPLLRYDTDDLAELPTESCPCGRTLQSFTNIRGRYRRTAHLPAGTWEFWDALLLVFEEASPEEMQAVKQYQLHQLNELEYHLKLKVSRAIDDSLRQRLLTCWQQNKPNPKARFDILELDRIEQRGKKFQDFISDITP